MSKQKKNEDPVEQALRRAENKESELPPDADVEERFNEFWRKNGFAIFVGIAIGAIAVLAYQISIYVGERREGNIQAAYLAVETREDRIAFAEENRRHPLAGMVWLQLADESFDQDDFGTALEHYDRAARALENAALVGRARLGSAMSELMMGNRDDARRSLNVLSADRTILEATRAEAAYHLAVIHWQDNDIAAMEDALDLIHGLEAASLWAFRANILRQRVPAIETVEEDRPQELPF